MKGFFKTYFEVFKWALFSEEAKQVCIAYKEYRAELPLKTKVLLNAMKLINLVLWIALFQFFVSCNGGGGSSSAPERRSVVPPELLVSMSLYMDYPIEGVSYIGSRNNAGSTASDGSLSCYAQEIVTFYIRNQIIGSSVCVSGRKWFVHELTGSQSIYSAPSLALILSVIDDDSDPTNGYKIPNMLVDFGSLVQAINLPNGANRSGSVKVNSIVETFYPDQSRNYLNDAASDAAKTSLSNAVTAYQATVKTNDFSNSFVSGANTVTHDVDLAGCGYDEFRITVTRGSVFNGVVTVDDPTRVNVRLMFYNSTVLQDTLSFQLFDSEDTAFVSRYLSGAEYRIAIMKLESNDSTLVQNDFSGSFQLLNEQFASVCSGSFTATCQDGDVDGFCD